MQFKYIDELALTQQKSKLIYNEISNYIEQKVQEALDSSKQDYEQKLQNIQLDSIIEKEIALSGARNVKSVMALIDKDKLSLKNGQVPSLKQKIQELKNDPNTSFLFFNNDNSNFRGITPFESKLHNSKKLDNMDYEELCQYYNDFNF